MKRNKKLILYLSTVIVLILMILIIIFKNRANKVKVNQNIYSYYTRMSAEIYKDDILLDSNGDFGGEYIIIEKENLSSCIYISEENSEPYCQKLSYKIDSDTIEIDSNNSRFGGKYKYELDGDRLTLIKEENDINIVIKYQKPAG